MICHPHLSSLSRNRVPSEPLGLMQAVRVGGTRPDHGKQTPGREKDTEREASTYFLFHDFYVQGVGKDSLRFSTVWAMMSNYE